MRTQTRIVDRTVYRPRVKSRRRWALSPEDEAVLVANLRQTARPRLVLLADFLAWTAATGLRIHETLGIRWADMSAEAGRPIIALRGRRHGLRPDCASLFLNPSAAAILERRRESLTSNSSYAFPPYRELRASAWAAQGFLDFTDPRVATLRTGGTV